MSYQEKRTIVTMVTSALLLAAYGIYVFGRVQAGLAMATDIKFWAGTMLVFVGINIAANIVIQIVFHILLAVSYGVRQHKETGGCDEAAIDKQLQSETTEDEMDKMISLKSSRVAFIVAGIGFVAGLAAVMFGAGASALINAVYIGFSLGTIVESIAQMHFYRKGV
jgi:hypothetical protein